MKTIPVTSVLCYLTQVEGLTWRDQDYRARKMVKILKGDPINGYLDAGPKGNQRRYTSENQNDFIPILIGAIAPEVRVIFPANTSLVPIPNSNATVDTQDSFPTLALAEKLAALVGNGVRAEPLLRWQNAKVPAHKGGSRNPQVHLENLVVLGKPSGPVVLFDDVMTTGGQLIAAYRALAATGYPADRAFVFGRAIKLQKPQMIALAEEQLEVEEAPFEIDW